jgi:citrate lyase synthetase
MMEPFERIDIQELPLSVPTFRRKVEDFLGSNGLRLEEVDLYLAVLDADDRILAGGGLSRDLIKCIAVSEQARSLGLSVPLISRLIAVAADRGHANVKVFTKPENRSVFESLGFRVLAEAPKAILMENGRGLEDYCRYLRAHQAPGVIVMNANPFTLGHQYLIEQASATDFSTRPAGLGRNDKDPATGLGRNDRSIVISSDARRAESRNLVIIPVREDASLFPYSERLAMIRSGCDGLADVVDGSAYQISAATFPTYFLKDLSDAAETQMRLDIDLFGRHIAPALCASVRFVGSEPSDPLTARYNALMKELLPSYGVEVVEIPRRQTSAVIPSDVSVILSEVEESASQPITATTVRALLDAGRYREASALTPESTWPYLLAFLAERALLRELDTPLKPGLVGPDSVGAHRDMDYGVMRKGIAAIRPFFPRMALAASPEELRQLGIDAEKAMLAATGGVNTHRGAIFALGLALNAAGQLSSRRMESGDNERFMKDCLADFAQSICRKSLTESVLHSTAPSHGAKAVKEYGVKGARGLACEGYKPLFEDWLPYYRNLQISPLAPLGRNDSALCHFERSREICTLLRIMATLDDTCVIHRVGYERAMEVKDEAKAMAGRFDMDRLKSMCDRYASEGISPGGAADMLALTIFMDSILN